MNFVIKLEIFQPHPIQKVKKMKKLSLPLIALIALTFLLSSYRSHKPTGSPIVFWTANCNYGPIEIFVNDVYQGDITKCSTRVPDCASPGFVTVIISGPHNVWRAQTKDGSRKWASQRCTEPSGVCNSERLD